MAPAERSSRVMSFPQPASIPSPKSSSSCTMPRLRTAQPQTITDSSPSRGTLTTALTCAATSTSRPKSQWAFRFSNGLETNPTAGFTTPGGTVGSKIITNYYQYMGSHTWTLSPTVVNVASFGWTNFYNSLGLYSQGTTDAVTKLGIPNLQPGPSTTWGIPSVGFTGDIFSGIGDSSDGPYVTSDPDIAVNDNIAWVHGKHSIDLGFQYERQTFKELGNQFSRGNFTTLANATASISTPGVADTGTGSAFADFLLGDLYTSTYAVQIAQADYKRNVEAAYIDDNYRSRPSSPSRSACGMN